MGKPFEIEYSPSKWDAPPGGVAQAWSVPYGGLNVQFPENQIGQAYTPAMDNFAFRNAELRSRNAFQVFLPGPDGGNPILGVCSFLSRNLVYHTLSFTTNGAFQLRVNAVPLSQQGINPWARLGGPLLPANLVAFRTFQSVLYYTNGSGHLSAWDGSNPAPLTDVAFTGTTFPLPNNYTGTTFSSLFLGELDSHMIMAYTIELSFTSGAISGSQTFPQRIRWSNVGFNPGTTSGFGSNLGTGGATFDPTVNVNAGLNDFLDVTDIITGIAFVGRMGYIFRQNGITEVNPTGVGTAPFDFNHLWASEQGVGNVYPGSIAQYGNYVVFVANNNVYQLTPGNVGPIGAGCRDAIMLDLSNAIASPTATIIPSYSLYRVYLTYQLFIPLSGGITRMYVYAFEDNNWAKWTLNGVVISRPTGCWIGDTVIGNQSIVTSR